MVQPSFIPKPKISIFTSIPSPFCFLLTLCTLALYTLHHHHLQPNPTSQTALHFHQTFLSLTTNTTISYYLRRLTLYRYLAGTPLSAQTAQYIHSHFCALDFPTHVNDYSALLSYPSHSSLIARFGDETVHQLPLAEPGFKWSDDGIVMPYHVLPVGVRCRLRGLC